MNVVALRRVVLLLSGFGFLCVEAEIPVQPDFDVKKFAGQWYPISAVKNKWDAIRNVSHAPLFKAKAKDRLSWSIDSPVEGTKCKKETFYLPQFDHPGKYKTKGQNVVRIVETDYSSYSIIYTEAPCLQLVTLYARTKEASDEVKEKFKKAATSLGFPAYKIYPMRLAECAEPKIYVS